MKLDHFRSQITSQIVIIHLICQSQLDLIWVKLNYWGKRIIKTEDKTQFSVENNNLTHVNHCSSSNQIHFWISPSNGTKVAQRKLKKKRWWNMQEDLWDESSDGPWTQSEIITQVLNANLCHESHWCDEAPQGQTEREREVFFFFNMSVIRWQIQRQWADMCHIK